MLRLAIVEDEEEILAATVRIIEDHCPFIEICGTAADTVSAMRLLQTSSPDIALLDINLPGGTSFDVLKSLGKINFRVIFLTAFEEYAIQAIKISALDYLLKPVDPLELITSLSQAYSKIEAENNNLKIEALMKNLGGSATENKVLVLRTSDSINVVEVKDIIRCESDSCYTTFYLSDSHKIMMSKPLKEYEEMLSQLHFIRPHQSHLVNMRYIKRYEKNEGGYIIMRDGSEVPVSTRKKDTVIKAIESMARL